MAVLEIQGNFGNEQQKSNERFERVAKAIDTIRQQIDVLNGAWQDDKSAEFISALEAYTSEISSKLSLAQTSASETFANLMKCLEIYQ